jgi:rare lipoprotein A
MKILQSIITAILLSSVTSLSEATTLKTSFYHQGFLGRQTASGETFSATKNTAASNRFKFGTIIQLSYEGKLAKVCINDTGGFAKYHRDLDVSRKVARTLGFEKKGVVSLKSVVLFKPKKRTSCKEAWGLV